VSIRLAILGIVSQGPTHGYAIRTRLVELIGEFWPINQGQVYATLARMASSGAIEAIAELPGGSSETRPYALREDGRRAFAAWLERPAIQRRERSELLAKVALLVSRGDTASAQRLLAAQRQRCESATRSLRRAGRAGTARREDRRARARELLRSAALAHVGAELDWLLVVEREVLAPSVSAPPQRRCQRRH
jgi:DNA-binding PadR family transcriptional regulator